MSKTVLFIDDDEAFHMIVRRVCRRIPAVGAVLEAKNGAEALEMLGGAARGGGELPDLAFVDINMPVLDGFGFLEGLQELIREFPSVSKVKPVVMMSSSSQTRDQERARELGADEYIEKGMSLAEIAESIGRVMS